MKKESLHILQVIDHLITQGGVYLIVLIVFGVLWELNLIPTHTSIYCNNNPDGCVCARNGTIGYGLCSHRYGEGWNCTDQITYCKKLKKK